MDTEVVRQFLNFFQDFINLCQLEHWPENDTTQLELRNAFHISQHIDKCLDKLQKNGLINEFLLVLNNQDETMSSILKKCLEDPPKFVLGKIIKSNTKINIMDIGIKVFIEMFSEEKFVKCLTDFMVEAASKETLLKNLTKEIPKDKVLEFRSTVFLSELDSCSSHDVTELLKDYNQDSVELLVVSLVNRNPTYDKAVKKVVDIFLNIVLSKDNRYRAFWKALIKIESKYLVEMCVEHDDIYTYIVKALLDCGKLLREHLSAESFYIDLSYSELANVVQTLCSNEGLKRTFFEIVRDHDTDINFWENIL